MLAMGKVIWTTQNCMTNVDYLNLVEWSVADVKAIWHNAVSGSPTKVKAIQNIVFQAKESKTIGQ
jgi:electron transfer flavoprotein beta subunit